MPFCGPLSSWSLWSEKYKRRNRTKNTTRYATWCESQHVRWMGLLIYIYIVVSLWECKKMKEKLCDTNEPQLTHCHRASCCAMKLVYIFSIIVWFDGTGTLCGWSFVHALWSNKKLEIIHIICICVFAYLHLQALIQYKWSQGKNKIYSLLIRID